MDVFERAAYLEKRRISFALVTMIEAKGSGPRRDGRMVVEENGTFHGTVGGGAMEREAIDLALDAIKDGRNKRVILPVRKEGMAELMIDVPVKDRRAVIVGGGHVGAAIADIFHTLGWRTIIVDTRGDIANSTKFPYSDIHIDEDLEKAFLSADINKNTAVIITNPDDSHKLEGSISSTPAFYVGMLGSRKRKSENSNIRIPIGLDIGSETPEEVALSIAGEVMAVFNGRKGGFRKDFRSNLVIVRGAGDLATGTIIRLHNAGYDVIALETDCPTVIRRTVSFAESVFEGECTVEGVKAIKAEDIKSALSIMDDGYVPVLIDKNGEAIEALKPLAVVDAILAKKNLGTKLDMAPFVVALGPGFTAGVDSDAVIETKRGHRLGVIIREGSAEANTGIPGIIGGYGKERVMHSECEGIFRGVAAIGDIVKKGDVIAYVDDTPVLASLDGRLRGLLHDGLFVPKGFKIADIDPRGESTDHTTISDKARAIGGGVLEAIDGFRSR